MIYTKECYFTIKRIKPNDAELGRHYHCDPRTVKKYYEAGKENELEKSKENESNKIRTL